ncbi:AraC family transcriptional regulator ligand-binding domain-containing protein [Rhizobium sp. AQ_MP]|uniref:AraC family transcriptional regulator n=1 Tax=Rhizobium sp. AQ_MP TaxID=2761536 RepID=UPI00163A557B|nr:AraC family transcriptional regulator [Rhizobium sp. AQ_MP]MBC2771232.1 AraC family transcriptional regulator ligand-binding domain-containing protein [Rhizobium sp. AQ_MP]
MPPRNLTDELTTVAGLASAVVEHARSYGIDIKPICKALEIDPEVFQSLTARISLDRLCRLLETCALLADDESFGLSSIKRYEAGSTGPFGYGLMAAPTGLDFVRFLDDHIQYVTHTSYSRLTLNERGGHLAWTFAPLIVKRDQYVDMSVGLVMQRARQLANSDSIEIELERPAPRNPQPFRQMLSRRISFGTRVNCVHFPQSFLEAQNPTGDRRLFELMDMQCRSLRPPVADQSAEFIDQVRRYLLLHVSDDDYPLAQIAPYFGLSERTFQRRLATHGTSLNELRDQIRKEVSFNLLTESELPISEICYRLGYSAPSAFTRSVTRWFGTTPSEVRERKSA